MAYLKTLSPVHIASGEQIDSMFYYLEQDKIYVYQPDTVFAYLNESVLNDRNFYNYLVSNRKENGRGSYFKTLDQLVKNRKVSAKVKDNYEYQLHKRFTISKAPARNRYNRSESNAKPIQSCIKAINTPYIPGSTLKGVMRTAILYDYLLNKGISYIEEKINKTSRKLMIDDLVFGNTKNGYNKDVRKDVFRLLQVPDCSFVKQELAAYELTRLNMGSNVKTEIIEAVEPDVKSHNFNFPEAKHDKLQAMYNLTVSEERLNAEIFAYFNKIALKKALYRYMKDLLAEEISYYQRSSALNVVGKKRVLQFLRQISKLNTPESPVIRVGKHTGYYAHTISLAVKNLDQDFFVKHFKNKFREGMPRNMVQKEKPNNFPKTRAVVGSLDNPMLLGYVQIKEDHED